MSADGVSVLSVGTTRLYPRPYVSRPLQTKQDQKGAPNKSKEPFADLDRLLASAASSLHQEALPPHRWEHNATLSPVGTPHSIFFAQHSLVAYFFTNRLQVFNTTTSTRLFEFVFESEDGESKWPITDVVECSLPPQGATPEDSISSHTILVSVMTGPESGKIYLIDFITARTLLWLNVPFAVTKLLPAWSPTSWSPEQQGIVEQQGLYSKFKEPLILGTRGGLLVVMDMYFDHEQLQEEDEDRKMERWTEQVASLSHYDPLSWTRSRRGLSHPWYDLTRPHCNPENLDSGIFDYLDPQPGEFVGTLESSQQVPRAGVSITALSLLWPSPPSGPVPRTSSRFSSQARNGGNAMDASTEIDVRDLVDENGADESGSEPSHWIPGLATPLVLVGYNFGTFQIWGLDSAQILYCSPVSETRAAVTSFETQSLHNLWDTPNENKVLIWVARGSISTSHTQQAHPPSISCYGLSLIKNNHNGILLGATHPPLQLADCISSVIAECSTILPSPYEGNHYYGQVLSMQSLPCWESPVHNNSSIAFVFETFPPRAISPQQPHQAISKHNTSIPTKCIECHILSTSSLSTGSQTLFPIESQATLLDLTMPYQVDPLTKDHSQTLSFSIIPASVQHYFPNAVDSSSQRKQQQKQQQNQGTEEEAEAPQDPSSVDTSSPFGATRAHVSFSSIAVTHDSIWKIGYASFGQQLLNAISEQGPLIFDNPEVISHVLQLLGRQLPSSADELHSLREELFTLALHNNLAGAICEYVLDAAAPRNTSSTFASLSLNIRPSSVSSSSSANLHHVLTWARTTYINVLETSHSLVDSLLDSSGLLLQLETQNLILELSQAKRLLNDLFNIVKSLTLRYKTQRQKWDNQEAHMHQDLEKISLGRQYVECGLWFAQNPINFDPDVLKHKVDIRRSRATECARNSPTQWVVSLDSNSEASSVSISDRTPPITVKAKPFDAKVHGLLQIDHLVKSMTAGEQTLAFEYPPTSSKTLVSLCRYGESIFIAQKHQVIFYVLLDISEGLADDFATRMMMTQAEQNLIRGLHHVDANNYDAAMRYLNDTRVVAIMNDEVALYLLRTLNDAHAFPHALSLYRVRQPPLDSLETVTLVLYVLLCNGLVSDAFFMARHQSRTTMDSFDPLFLHTLFFHLLRHSYNNNILKDVFQLPLDAVEANALKHFLLHMKEDRGRAADLHMVYLLQRNRVPEAVSWYHSQKQGQSTFDLDPENEKMKTTLLNNYIQTLPPIIREGLKPAEPLLSFGFARSGAPSSQRPQMMTTAAGTFTQPSLSVSGSISGTPSKKLVTKLFNSSQKPSGSSARFAPASLGPALLSPTTPGKFARSPVLFRPTIVLSSPAIDTTSTTTGITAATGSAAAITTAGDVSKSRLPTSASAMDASVATVGEGPRASLFSPLSRNLFGSPKPVSATSNIPLTSSTMQPAPFIIPRESLVEEDSSFVTKSTPTAPISTPTKRVMETVKQKAEEATRKSRAIADFIVLSSSDEDEGEELEEDEVEEIEEVEEEDEKTYRPGGQWDYDVQQIESYSSASDSEDVHRRGRSHRGAPMEEDEPVMDDDALERIRDAHSVDHTEDEGEDVDEDDRSQTAGSIAESHSRVSRRSALSALSKLSQSTRSTKASTASKAKKSQAAKASKATSKTKLAPVAEAEESQTPGDITPASSARSRRSTRSSIAALVETAESAPRRSKRRSTAPSVDSSIMDTQPAAEGEEDAAASSTARASRRSSRLSIAPSSSSLSASMIVDEPEASVSRRSKRRSNLSNLSSAATSRRQSSGFSDIPSEPLGIHPQKDDGEASDSGGSEVSGDTARIRRSSRTKTAKPTSSVTTRAKSLKVTKDRTSRSKS